MSLSCNFPSQHKTLHNAIFLIYKQSLYLTKWKRSKVIIKHRKKTIFPYKHKLNVQNHSKTKLYRPTAAGGGSSDTNEGIVVNPMKGGKAAVGSRSDLDFLSDVFKTRTQKISISKLKLKLCQQHFQWK